MTKRNSHILVQCKICGTNFHPWYGREETSMTCSSACHGPYLRALIAARPDRFDRLVDKSGDCWIWNGTRNKLGYGILNLEGRRIRAHRYFYERENGPIPDGLLACHTCDNPRCVRPDHLFLGTNTDNMRDMVSKGRHRKWPNLVGEQHPRAKITAEIARKIRATVGSSTEIAKLYGISPALVHGIKQRRNWKHA